MLREKDAVTGICGGLCIEEEVDERVGRGSEAQILWLKQEC